MYNIRFKLAECATLTRVARVFVDDCIQQVLDECVQMHAGYGYMNECLVCRMFADTRVQRIYGGTNEIMKEAISRSV